MKTLITILISAFFLSCCGDSEKTNSKKEENQVTKSADKSLNITILLDLSDRLVRDLSPSQPVRDLAIVNELTEIFKSSMVEKGAFGAKDKIKVLFKPTPKDPNINSISRELNVDLSNLQPKEKKKVYDSIREEFSSNLKLIYDTTLEDKTWLGSDIWRFFKNDVKDLVIEDESKYRNILVVLTDGYIYHKNSATRDGNKTTYITNSFFKRLNLYSKSNWRNYLESNNYGLISIDQKFPSLEVIFFEVNPMKNSLEDEEFIRWYLADWLNKMDVKDFRVYNTDLTPNTLQRLNSFIH